MRKTISWATVGVFLFFCVSSLASVERIDRADWSKQIRRNLTEGFCGFENGRMLKCYQVSGLSCRLELDKHIASCISGMNLPQQIVAGEVSAYVGSEVGRCASRKFHGQFQNQITDSKSCIVKF